jgi:WD40 repeat protein
MSFVWPPSREPNRAPYRGWLPFDPVDAGVFFGRDAAILRAMDALRGMRDAGVKSLFVILGPSGSGKSSFLRAGDDGTVRLWNARTAQLLRVYRAGGVHVWRLAPTDPPARTKLCGCGRPAPVNS